MNINQLIGMTVLSQGTGNRRTKTLLIVRHFDDGDKGYKYQVHITSLEINNDYNYMCKSTREGNEL